jgi:hypothetical protein
VSRRRHTLRACSSRSRGSCVCSSPDSEVDWGGQCFVIAGVVG